MTFKLVRMHLTVFVLFSALMVSLQGASSAQPPEPDIMTGTYSKASHKTADCFTAYHHTWQDGARFREEAFFCRDSHSKSHDMMWRRVFSDPATNAEDIELHAARADDAEEKAPTSIAVRHLRQSD